MKMVEKIFDIESGETIFNEREATQEEIARIEALAAAAETAARIEAANASARKVLLEKLGITEEEAKLLLS